MVGCAKLNIDARAEVLARIRAALQSSDSGELAAVPASPVPALDNVVELSVSDRCSRFATELKALGGEAVVVSEMGSEALASAVAEHVERAGFKAIAVQREPLALLAAAMIPSPRVVDPTGLSIDQLEKADCAIVAAESLIADSGSAVIRLATNDERLLPYLPPACIIIARTSAIAATLTDAALAAGPDERGERAIVTGPSRTADIEKTVVLGAHGPGSLVVIIAPG